MTSRGWIVAEGGVWSFLHNRGLSFNPKKEVGGRRSGKKTKNAESNVRTSRRTRKKQKISITTVMKGRDAKKTESQQKRFR